MVLHVEVTAEDVARGVPNDSGSCPVALALRRIFPGGRVKVMRDAIRVTPSDGPPFRAIPSREVRAFVLRFDHRLHVEPFVFDLEPIVPMAP